MPAPQLPQELALEALRMMRQHGMRRASEILGIPERTVQSRARMARETATEGPLVFEQPVTRKRLFITSAQNATPVHKAFLASLLVACKALDAQLLVVPIRYKNPTSTWTSNDGANDWWAPEVTPYLCNERKVLGKHLVLLGDVKTVPTAEQPLAGFETMTHSESAILGHPRLQLKTVPVPRNRMPKLLTTTGSVTVRNYTDSKTGKKGDFHHTFGACFVELRGSKFHLRQINADKDGSFIDLDKCYRVDGVAPAPRALALVMGDTHVDFVDPAVEAATFGARGMVRTLKPRTLVWHDVLDGYSRNPHHRDNVFNEIAKRGTGRHDVAAEVARAIAFLGKYTPKGVQSVVVSSNHDEFLARWVRDTDWRRDPDNAKFYLATAAAMVDSTRLGVGGLEVCEPFAYWVKKNLGSDRVRCLRRDESFEVAGIELGFHGDRGPNGARGSIRNYRGIGPKVVIGHSHSPGIEQGAYQTGTSTRLRLEYNSGPSSWLQTHVVVYANGKRALLSIIDGEWR